MWQFVQCLLVHTMQLTTHPLLSYYYFLYLVFLLILCKCFPYWWFYLNNYIYCAMRGLVCCLWVQYGFQIYYWQYFNKNILNFSLCFYVNLAFQTASHFKGWSFLEMPIKLIYFAFNTGVFKLWCSYKKISKLY